MHGPDAYVKPGHEQQLFPNVGTYLPLDAILRACPSGQISHDQFQYQGRTWRLLSRRPAGPSSAMLHLAVLDSGDLDTASPLRCSLPHIDGLQGLESPRSRPLNSRPLSDVDSQLWDMSSPPGAASSKQQYPSPPNMALAALGQASLSSRFMEDLLSAESSLSPMERYKALIRLMSSLRRRIAAAGIAQPQHPQSWAGPEQQDCFKQILMVGECLARLGTAEFSAERSNSSRAINTKDYATLLTQASMSTAARVSHSLRAGTPLWPTEP